jgi:hypothetical protein
MQVSAIEPQGYEFISMNHLHCNMSQGPTANNLLMSARIHNCGSLANLYLTKTVTSSGCIEAELPLVSKSLEETSNF